VEKAPPCWSPGGRQQCGGGSGVGQSMTRPCREKKAWQETNGYSPNGVGPPPLARVLTPSLRDARTAPKVQTLTERGAPSGETRGETAIDEPEVVVNKPEVPPTEPDRPPPNTSPPLERDSAPDNLQHTYETIYVTAFKAAHM